MNQYSESSVLKAQCALPIQSVTNKFICANIKSKRFPELRCTYPVVKGDFCKRHCKKPVRYEKPSCLATRSIHASARKIQKWWIVRHGLELSRERSVAFFCRDICNNDKELASFEPLDTVPRDYFFVLRDEGTTRFWGFDIRTLVVQYESDGKLENPYTKSIASPEDLLLFHKRVALLRKSKKPLHFEEISGLTADQTWNLRVLDICLRLDILGYRIATKWFSDLNLQEHQQLYSILYNLWNVKLGLTIQEKERIVPEFSSSSRKLFKISMVNIYFKTDIDSIRRTNLTLIERLISSASAQSDRTLGAMYSVMALCYISARCRNAYSWLVG